jgi:hypothetical protein
MSDLCANKVRVKHTGMHLRDQKEMALVNINKTTDIKNIKKVGMHTSVR